MKSDITKFAEMVGRGAYVYNSILWKKSLNN